MKKTLICFAAIAIFILSFSACIKTEKHDVTEKTNSTISVSSEESSGAKETESFSFSEPVTVSVDAGGGSILQDKYRVRYYNVTASFIRLVDEDEFRAWQEKIYEVYPNETNEMIMKRFIQDFNISREDFDKANHELAKSFSEMEEVPTVNPKDYLNQEIFEVYNGDIIYTFDDEIINEYYLSSKYPFCYQDEYENAVLLGTYKTQTTDFYFDYDDHSTVKLRGYKYAETTAAETTASIPENDVAEEQPEATAIE